MTDDKEKRKSVIHLEVITHDCQENNKLIVQKTKNDLDNLQTTLQKKLYELRHKKSTVKDLQQNHRGICPPVPTPKPRTDINGHNSYTG